jgi:hypothetical protein
MLDVADGLAPITSVDDPHGAKCTGGRGRVLAVATRRPADRLRR